MVGSLLCTLAGGGASFGSSEEGVRWRKHSQFITDTAGTVCNQAAAFSISPAHGPELRVDKFEPITGHISYS